MCQMSDKFLFAVLCLLTLVSFLYHALVPFQSTLPLQWGGVGMMSCGLFLLVLAMVRARRPAKVHVEAIWIVAVTAGLLLYSRQMGRLPLWYSEGIIIECAKSLLAGSFIHPFRPSGDFPSSFLNFAVAPLLYLTHSPLFSVRFLPVLFGLTTVVLVGLTGRWLLGNVGQFYLFLALPLFSIWQIHLCNVNDNNWISAMPAFVAGQLYLFLRVRRGGGTASLLCLSFICGLSFWTLYVPAISALLVSMFVLTLPSASLPPARKLKYIMGAAVFVAPLVGGIINSPSLMQRHAAFLKGGEYKETEFQKVEDIPKRYLKSTLVILRSSLPALERTHSNLRLIVLEPTTFVLLLVGLVLAPFSARPHDLWYVYLHLILLFMGIILSNPLPSTHRIIALSPFLFIFAGLGAEKIVQANCRLFGSRVGSGSRLILALVHAGAFALYYREYSLVQFTPERSSSFPKILAEKVRELRPDGKTLLLPARHQLVFSSYFYPSPPIIGYDTCSQIRSFVELGRPALLAVERDESAAAQEPCIETVPALNRSLTTPLSTPDGRAAGVLYRIIPQGKGQG